MAAFANFVVRFRVAIVLAWAVALIGAMVALPSLSGEVNSDPSLFLSSNARSVAAQALGSSLTGGRTTATITIVAARPAGPVSTADLAAVDREVKLARAVPGVTSVRAVAVAPSERAVQLEVDVAREQTDVAGLRPVVDDLESTFATADLPPGLEMHVAGQVADNAANNKSANGGMKRVELLSVVFIVVLLLLVLRSPVAVAVAFVPSVVSLLVAEKFIAGLGAHGLEISTVTQTLLIVLILGAGTDYGLFLIYRFREEVRAGADPPDAIVRALTRVGESIIASAGTVIVALLTLLLAGFGLYHDLGVPLAIGVAVMLLAGLTLLPALTSLAGRAMFRAAPPDASAPADGWWGGIAARAIQRPGRVLTAGVLVLGALALAALGYQTAGLSRGTSAPAGSDAATGDTLVARYFPQSSASPASLILRFAAPVWEHPAALTAAQSSLSASGLFDALAGPLDPNGTALAPATYATLHAELGNPRALPLRQPASSTLAASVYQAYRATARYVSQNGTTIRYTAGLRAGPQQSTAAMNATPAVRTAVSAAARRSGATASGVAGQAAGLYDVSSTADGDMIKIIPVAVLAIAVLLGLVLRSLIVPLYLVVSIVLSYLAALGLTTLLVIDIGGQDGLVFILPFLMFVFLLALGEDYNILVMTRIREEARDLPLRAAVVRAVGRTGPVVTSAGLILAGTFGVFALAGGGIMNGQLQAIGLGLALGVLLDTFVVRTLLVPSAVVLLGRLNWWPSAMSHRVQSHAADQLGR